MNDTEFGKYIKSFMNRAIYGMHAYSREISQEEAEELTNKLRSFIINTIKENYNEN